MKSKASLLLMEQLIMVLVFALAAAVCLRIFAKSDSISKETAKTDAAVVLAQNAAETLKATGGDAAAAEALGEDGYRVAVIRKASPLPGLDWAEIQIFFEETLLFSLNTGWQEAFP